MEPRSYEMALLFDFYGDLLTGRQKEFFDLYYNEDLSLGEIAENSGISRQGVRDVLMRAQAILTEMEEKTGSIARFQELGRQAQLILDATDQLEQATGSRRDCQIDRLIEQIRQAATRIKE